MPYFEVNRAKNLLVSTGFCIGALIRTIINFIFVKKLIKSDLSKWWKFIGFDLVFIDTLMLLNECKEDFVKVGYIIKEKFTKKKLVKVK